MTPDGTADLEVGADSFTGYSIIEAHDREAALALARTNPMITSVVVHELARM